MTGGPAVAPTAEARAQAEGGRLKPDVIPRSTYFPAALAFGITLLLWGLVTSPVVLGVGLVAVIVSLIGWVGELRHDE
jgi:hypothetical protein